MNFTTICPTGVKPSCWSSCPLKMASTRATHSSHVQGELLETVGRSWLFRWLLVAFNHRAPHLSVVWSTIFKPSKYGAELSGVWLTCAGKALGLFWGPNLYFRWVLFCAPFVCFGPSEVMIHHLRQKPIESDGQYYVQWTHGRGSLSRAKVRYSCHLGS